MTTTTTAATSTAADNDVVADDRQTIVVGVDGSKAAMRAMDWATAQARVRGACLHVVSTVATDLGVLPYAGPIHDWATLERLAQQMQEHALSMSDVEGLDVDRTVVSAHAGTYLSSLSAHADMVVLGTRGLGPVAGRLLGSVTHFVITRAACPVVLLREDEAHEGGVLVGFDGSPDSEHALRFALDHAEANGLPCEVVMALEPPSPLELFEAGWAGTAGLPPTAIQQGQVRLQELMAPFQRPGIDPTLTVIDDRADRALASRAGDAGLVVVGRRGHRTLPGMVLGSTGHRILSRLSCAVAVVPSPAA